jgi:hypothetical protein
MNSLRETLDTQGYIVVPGRVPQEMCDAVVHATWEFLEMDPNCPEDWYRDPLPPGGMVEMYHHPAMWAVRQHPPLYSLFCGLYDTDDLWVSIDRVGLKPPYSAAYPQYDHKGFIHWDIDVRRLPVPFALQAVLSLTDTDADMGGFCCVPGFHADLEAYLKQHPPPDGHRPVPGTFPAPTPIVTHQGDLVIWDTRLLHGNGRNAGTRPRHAMYVTMFPAQRAETRLVSERLASWQNLSPPPRDYFPGDPRGWEAAHYPPPTLSELGMRLLGGN